MRIPQDLRDADKLLALYGRWAMDRWKKQHCASIEHKYRPPAWEDEPTETLMPDFHAMDVQRVLQQVPLAYRRVLQAEYIPQRLPTPAIRRSLRLSVKTWEGSLLAGLRMFDNHHRLHTTRSVLRRQRG